VSLLAGVCAACTHYQAAPLEPEVSARGFAARGLDAPAVRDKIIRLLPEAAEHWPPQEWDRADLLAVALVQNPALAVADAEARVALAREVTAGERPNPDLTLQSEYARHDPYPWLYGVASNWLLRSPEQRGLTRRIAHIETKSARLELMEEAWTVRHDLTAALSEWESARRRSLLLVQLAAAQKRFVESERSRIAAGEDAPGELIASEHALIEIEQQQAELRAAALAAQAAAARSLGVPMQALDGVTIVWPNWGEPPLVEDEKLREMRERALLSRTDLGRAINDYGTAEAKLQLAVARQYPQYQLNPGFYWDHGIAKFPFDVSFALPFNGNKGEIAEARAGRDLAGERMLALQAAIYGQIAAADRAERGARDGVDAALRLLAGVRRQGQLAELGLRLGAADSQEQIGMQIIAARAELETVQMRAQLQLTRNELEDALHAPLSGPELELSNLVASPAGDAAP
jgi:outer membrane protein TolC